MIHFKSSQQWIQLNLVQRATGLNQGSEPMASCSRNTTVIALSCPTKYPSLRKLGLNSDVVDITGVIEKKKAALAAFGTQKYQGKSYNTPEYVNRRIESLEGYWGLINASTYAEEFIARQPHQVESLPTVKRADRSGSYFSNVVA